MTEADLPSEAAGRGQVLAARAQWHNLPEIVTEVAELRERFSGPDLCIAASLCDDHPADDTAFLVVDRDLKGL
jgi:hypothetical protein